MQRLSFLLFLMLCLAHALRAHPLAFPGAEGGGKYCSGGRGGKVFFVDNLNDKGKGSLRRAIEQKGPRIVVFRVSGTIELSKPIYIKNDSLTIAGQSAPGGGICLKKYGIVIEADNVIIRYIRIRPGNDSGEETDAISCIGNRNIIIDHCSFSWSNDETASFYNNTHFTLQWCIISESLNKSAHHKGEHGYGGIWGGNNATFHHNLLSDHKSRNPRFCGSRYTNKPKEEKVDFRNNVVYNWGDNSTYGGEEGFYNMVNNYYKPGPATSKNSAGRILELTLQFFDPRYNTDTLGPGRFFLRGNVVEGDHAATRNNWKYGVQGKGVTCEAKAVSKLRKPVSLTELKTEKASKAFRRVLLHAGASIYQDSVDNRIVNETLTGNEQFGASFRGGHKGIIDSPSDTGGWPLLPTLDPPADADEDGMPDNWEKRNNLDPGNPDDNTGYMLSRVYTNIEVFLNSLADNHSK